MKRFYYRLPGSVYANGPVVCRSKAALRLEILASIGRDRLPRGTEMWPAGLDWWR